MTGGPLLQIRGLSKAFGGIRAVDECSLDVHAGTITGLIGPNGAGKSTLFNVVAGLYAPDAGEIRLGGRRIDGLPPHLVVGAGLLKTWQVPREFRNLPVLDNAILAARGHPGEGLVSLLTGPWAAMRHEALLEEKARRTLGLVGLAELAEAPAGSLSGGQKKLLELARALMADPVLILLDEPMAGVNPVLAGRLMEIIDRLRREGHTFFLIEHDMEVVMARCDRIIVMHEGRKIAEGLPLEVRTNPVVLESYLGG